MYVEFKIPKEKIIFSQKNTRGDILANQMYMIALNMPSKKLEFSEVDFNQSFIKSEYDGKAKQAKRDFDDNLKKLLIKW